MEFKHMTIIYAQIIGCGIFAGSAFVLGIMLKRNPEKIFAEMITRIMHLIIIFAVIIPVVIGFISPGLTHYDALLRIPSLPFRTISLISGVVIMLVGQGLMLISILALLDYGQGLFLIDLTQKVAMKDIYKFTRNPMMLGLYLSLTALGLLTGSTYFLLWSLLALIPANVFYLKSYEERELEIRFGQSYREYKQSVPFLIPSFRKMSATKSTNIEIG